MNRLFFTTLILGSLSLGLMGCNEENKSSIKRETTIETPGGTTTITTEKEVKQSPDKTTNETP